MFSLHSKFQHGIYVIFLLFFQDSVVLSIGLASEMLDPHSGGKTILKRLLFKTFVSTFLRFRAANYIIIS